MRGGVAAAGLGLLLLLAAAFPASAQERVGVRVGNHPTYGRVVLDWTSPPPYTVENRDGDRVLLRFEGVAAAATVLDLAAARRPPRNILRVAATAEGLEITLSPGATFRHFRLGARVVLDALDPAPPASTEPAAAADPSAPAARRGAPGPAREETTRSAPPAPATADARRAASAAAAGDNPAVAATAAAPAPAPAAATPAAAAAETRGASPSPAAPPRAAARVVPAAPPVPAQPASQRPGIATEPPAPQAIAAAEVSPPGPAIAPEPPPQRPAIVAEVAAQRVRLLSLAGSSRAALLPFGPDTGLALLRRGDVVLAVFDRAQPLDLAALRRDPVLAGMSATVLPNGTQLTLPLAAPAVLRARRIDGAWVLEAAMPDAPSAPPEAMALEAMPRDPAAGDRVLIRAGAPGRVVAVVDPETGLPILLGTLREAGQAILQPRRLAEADLPATLQGAAVLARSDRVSLRQVEQGFVLAAAGAGSRLALDPALVAAAAPSQPMTRLFDIPALPVAALADRLRGEQTAIIAAPPLARAALRRSAAETLLALGLPLEAQAGIHLARREDPAAAAEPVLNALAGVAALLAGRPAEADGLDDPRLPERDEVILWRAALAAARGRPQLAAPGFAATIPLIMAYPEGLRSRLLPLVADAIVEAGDRAALSRIVAAGGERPELTIARAALAETEGRIEDALAGYAAATEGRDRRARARALRRAIELELATGRIDAGEAARRLDATLFAWRGDEQEIAARRRVSELRLAAGDGRGALALLRETEQLFPDRAPGLQSAMRDAFLVALEREPPLEAVALYDGHPEMLPDTDPRAAAAVAVLAERLLALDLTERAANLLQRRLENLPVGEDRAALGLRLAGFQLEERDGAAAALLTLSGTEAPEIPASLQLRRTVLAAQAEMRRGALPRGVALLRALPPEERAEPLTDLLVEARDWPGAAAAHAELLRMRLPDAPAPLDAEARRALLRQAALLALAGDNAALTELRATQGPRMADGALAEAFAALTADPLRGLADLPRLQRELQLFRKLPGGLEPLRAASLSAR